MARRYAPSSGKHRRNNPGINQSDLKKMLSRKDEPVGWVWARLGDRNELIVWRYVDDAGRFMSYAEIVDTKKAHGNNSLLRYETEDGERWEDLKSAKLHALEFEAIPRLKADGYWDEIVEKYFNPSKRKTKKPTRAQAEAIANVWRAELRGEPVRPSTARVRATHRTSADGIKGSRPRGSIRPDVQNRIQAAGWIEFGTVENEDGSQRSGWITTAEGRRVVADFDWNDPNQSNPRARKATKKRRANPEERGVSDAEIEKKARLYADAYFESDDPSSYIDKSFRDLESLADPETHEDAMYGRWSNLSEYFPGWKLGDFQLLLTKLPQPPFSYNTDCACDDGVTRSMQVGEKEVRDIRRRERAYNPRKRKATKVKRKKNPSKRNSQKVISKYLKGL